MQRGRAVSAGLAPRLSQRSTEVPGIDESVAMDATDPRTTAWVAAHNARFEADVIASQPAMHAAIVKRAAELAPVNPAPRAELAGAQYQVIAGSLVRTDAAGSRPVVDAATLPAGAAVLEYYVSPDGSKVAYGVAANLGDWQQWQVRDIASGKDLLATPITLRTFGSQGVQFDADSQGIVYPVHDRCDLRKPTAIKLHRFDGSADVEIYRSGPYQVSPLMTASDGRGNFIVSQCLGVAVTPNTNVLVRKNGAKEDLTKPGDIARLAGVHGTEALFLTDAKRPESDDVTRKMYSVTAVDMDSKATRTIVPARADVCITAASLVGDKLWVQTLAADQRSFVEIYALDGHLLKRYDFKADLDLPPRGTLSAFSGNATTKGATEFTYSSVTHPPVTLRCDLNTLAITRVGNWAVPFDGRKVNVDYSTFTARDGAQVPLYMYSRVGEQPKRCLYYYYGNIGTVNGPQWNRIFQMALELGFGVALVGARGGNERGGAWRDAGSLHRELTEHDIVDGAREVRRRWKLKPRDMEAVGRSYGGWWTYQLAERYTHEFGAFQPTVPVADVAMFYEKHGWMPYDVGATMQANGDVTTDTEWLHKMATRFNPVAGFKRLPPSTPMNMLVAIENDDQRATPEQGRLGFAALTNRLGSSAKAYMVTLPGGHMSKVELTQHMSWLAHIYGIKELRPLT